MTQYLSSLFPWNNIYSHQGIFNLNNSHLSCCLVGPGSVCLQWGPSLGGWFGLGQESVIVTQLEPEESKIQHLLVPGGVSNGHQLASQETQEEIFYKPFQKCLYKGFKG